ncbi:hypothetical protein PIB30_060809 [Stylosanthes scabra]|uniref:Uncharacterized protein n=1 Tax=Stylosanthes scabra TaxID=79078 RepID=A0ABU6ZJD6_9FABA|nr:hypothetical protein [Stylosanthes scabra]
MAVYKTGLPLLAEDAALKPFKSYKQSVKQLKKIGNILTIVVAAEQMVNNQTLVEERFNDRVEEVMIMVENMNQMLDAVNKFTEEKCVILEASILRMEVQLEQVKARKEHWSVKKTATLQEVQIAFYFQIRVVPKAEWLTIVKIAMEGLALTWYRWWESGR